MEASLTEITGSEEPRGDGSVLDVLVGFYRASNARNLDALAANWATGDVPSMDNPIGGIRRRWQSISEGYAKLFGGPAVVRVTFYDFTSQRWERLASLRRAREGQLPHARCQDSSPHSNNPAGTPRSSRSTSSPRRGVSFKSSRRYSHVRISRLAEADHG
jgi:hypothetical protein